MELIFSNGLHCQFIVVVWYLWLISVSSVFSDAFYSILYILDMRREALAGLF